METIKTGETKEIAITTVETTIEVVAVAIKAIEMVVGIKIEATIEEAETIGTEITIAAVVQTSGEETTAKIMTMIMEMIINKVGEVKTTKEDIKKEEVIKVTTSAMVPLVSQAMLLIIDQRQIMLLQVHHLLEIKVQELRMKRAQSFMSVI
jgi:hypothetical protein